MRVKNQLAKKSAGFTLIEIMVATAIFALIGVGALSVLDTATKTSDNIKQDGDRLNQVQRTFLFLAGDLQQLSSRMARDEFGDMIPSIKSDPQSSVPMVRFTRLGRRNPAQLPRSNLEHLVYSVEDKVLYRTSYTYVDGMVEDDGLKREMLDAVEDMKLKFFDGENWEDYWPIGDAAKPEDAQTLPVAVKISLRFTDYGIIERLFFLSDKPAKKESP